MHSRIFQISREPIEEDNFVTEERYFDGFVGQIADYVGEDTDRKEDWKWLVNNTRGAIKIDEKAGTMTIVSKKQFFERKFADFKKALEEAREMTLDEFMSGSMDPDMTVYHIRRSWEDRYDFYIDDNDEYFGIVPLDEFMRHVNDGDVFYLGTTIDYHF